jgi:TonB family protein
MIVSPPLALAQHPEIEALVDKTAEDLARRKRDIVFVSYFRSPNGTITEAGRILSLEFSAKLAEARPEIHVISVSEMQALARERPMLLSDVFHPDVARLLSMALGAEAFVRGTLNLDGQKFNLDLEWVDAKKPRKGEPFSCHPAPLGKASAEFVGSPELRELFTRHSSEDESGYLSPGTAGMTFPRCKYCPTPLFPSEAKRRRIQGNVYLLITVTPSGTVESPAHICGPGAGLDDAAIRQVLKWRFEPAKDSDGKPHPMRVEIEVVFRLL